MRDISDKAKDLAIYRLKRAEEDFSSAKHNFEENDLRTANNRAYYSIFHALRAILALDEYDSKKHSGIISEFRVRYIKTNIFSSEISDMIGDAFVVRNKSDYDDMYVVSRDETQKQIHDAENVLTAVRNYLLSESIIS